MCMYNSVGLPSIDMGRQGGNGATAGHRLEPNMLELDSTAGPP